MHARSSLLKKAKCSVSCELSEPDIWPLKMSLLLVCALWLWMQYTLQINTPQSRFKYTCQLVVFFNTSNAKSQVLKKVQHIVKGIVHPKMYSAFRYIFLPHVVPNYDLLSATDHNILFFIFYLFCFFLFILSAIICFWDTHKKIRTILG